MRDWNRKHSEQIKAQRRAQRTGPDRARYLGYKKRHYEKNKHSVLAYQAKYRSENPEILAERGRKYRAQNPEIIRQKKAEEYQRNKAHYLKTNALWKANNPNWERDWYNKNKETINAKRNVYLAARRKTNPSFRAAASVRSRVWALLKKISVRKSISLGLEQAKLKEWLQDRFQPGMTWENYGTVWVVDHVIPCAEFDLSKPEQLRRCFHYHNLRPLWKKENMHKSAKLMRQTEFQLV